MKTEISLIVTTYNQPGFLELVLASIARQSISGFETIIADDGSGIDTSEVLNKYKNKVNLLHVWQEDKGYRKARILNAAARKSSGKYLIFIDGDCVIDKEFISAHYHFKSDKTFLAGRRVELGEKITKTITANHIEKGFFDGFNLKLFKSCITGNSKHFNRSFSVRNKWIRKVFGYDKVESILGSNFSLYREDLYSVNGFNEDLRHYWGEDGDLFIRLRNAGYSIKSLLGLATQFHLYHAHREPNIKMVEWYDTMLTNKEYRYCPNGIKNEL